VATIAQQSAATTRERELRAAAEHSIAPRRGLRRPAAAGWRPRAADGACLARNFN